MSDLELRVPLHKQVASLFAADVPVFWIPSNHNAGSSDAYDRLWGDHPDGNLHARCVELGGIWVAGLGGVFKGRVWRPDAEPVHPSRADYLEHLPHTTRWRGGLPLRARDAIFPEDLDAMARLRADMLVSHEAPSRHRHSHVAVAAAATTCGAQLVVHGHHHHAYDGTIGFGVRVCGLARAEVFKAAAGGSSMSQATVTPSKARGRTLEEGERIGRFLVIRDLDGRLHAVSAGGVAAMCESDDGTVLMLPGGRLVQVSQPLEVLLAWLNGRGPQRLL